MIYPELAVTGIGNAIVDILSQIDEAFVTAAGFAKGSMSLIDAERALALSNALRGKISPNMVYSIDPAQSFSLTADFSVSYVRPALTILP